MAWPGPHPRSPPTTCRQRDSPGSHTTSWPPQCRRRQRREGGGAPGPLPPRAPGASPPPQGTPDPAAPPSPRRAGAGARRRAAHARSGPALGWSGQLREQRPRPGGSEPPPAALGEPPGPPSAPPAASRSLPEPPPRGARGRLRGSDPRPLAPGWDS